MERISVERGAALLLERVKPLARWEKISPAQAPGRVLWESVTAKLDTPPFDRSPLDGYALRSVDAVGAGPEKPARLTLGEAVGPGTAVPVSTGSPIPAGADCVVKVEDTRRDGDAVLVCIAPAHWENYVFRGEDMPVGRTIFPVGTRMDWTHVAALAAQGVTALAAAARPKVGVLPTGGELVPAGAPLPSSGIYDANGPMLCARLQALGMEPVAFPPVGDDAELLAGRVRAALAKCDFLLTTGGVSVGAEDAMPRAAELLGAEVLFHGLAVRPGSPAMAFLAEGKPVLALSGNPFASLAVFEAVGRPALEKLAGMEGALPGRMTLPLAEGLPASQVRRFIRAVRTPEGRVCPAAGGHSSGMVWSLAGYDCLIDRSPGPALEPGSPVPLLIL